MNPIATVMSLLKDIMCKVVFEGTFIILSVECTRLCLYELYTNPELCVYASSLTLMQKFDVAFVLQTGCCSSLLSRTTS